MRRHSLRVIALGILILTVGAFLTGCGSSTPKITSISVFGDTAAPLTRGSTTQFQAIANYSNGTQGALPNVVWSSGDTSVATVSSTGLVTAVLRGSAPITATFNDMRSSRTVTVKGLGGGTLGAEGGSITVNLPGNPSNGMTVTLPANATAGGKNVHIEIDDEDGLPGGTLPTGAIKASQTFVLTKDSKYNFAKPVEVTIPVDGASLANGEFPVVFTWVEASKQYVANPVVGIDRTKNTVTIKTAYFGKMVAISIPTLAVLAQTTSFDTGFKPEVDGFFHPNSGNYDSAGGSCLGMSMFSEWYFASKKKTDGKALFSKYLEGDIARWQDDATAAELIDRTFETTKNIWSLYSNAATNDETLTAAETALEAWMTLEFTKQPQTLMIRFTNGQAHAVTVFGWDSQTQKFGIYDNNFPGDTTVTLGWNKTDGFVNYSKAGAYPEIKSFTLLPIGVAMAGPEFEALYAGAEAGWKGNTFDKIVFTSPVADTNGDYIVEGSQPLVVSGMVLAATTSEVAGRRAAVPASATVGSGTQVVYSWNGTVMGSAPVTNGSFSFTIPADKVVGFANTVSIVSTKDPVDVWDIKGHDDITTKIKGAIFFNNPGFEVGDFTGWSHETHTWQNRTPGSYTPEKSAIVDGQVQQFDEIDTALPTTYSGRYAARVNNDDDSYHISSVSQTVTVPKGSSPQIRFYWSAVLEDPNHPPLQQPYVDISVKDETAGTVLYTKHFFSNDPSYSGWIVVGGWKVIDWQPVIVDVSSAIGHNITVRIEAADCAQGGHGGYAYFDGDVQ